MVLPLGNLTSSSTTHWLEQAIEGNKKNEKENKLIWTVLN